MEQECNSPTLSLLYPLSYPILSSSTSLMYDQPIPYRMPSGLLYHLRTASWQPDSLALFYLIPPVLFILMSLLKLEFCRFVGQAIILVIKQNNSLRLTVVPHFYEVLFARVLSFPSSLCRQYPVTVADMPLLSTPGGAHNLPNKGDVGGDKSWRWNQVAVELTCVWQIGDRQKWLVIILYISDIGRLKEE